MLSALQRRCGATSAVQLMGTATSTLPRAAAASASQVRHFGVRHKLLDLDDAAALVRPHNTLVVSGFVGQGAPEALLRALEERFLATGEPSDLTLLFGGGPGDWATRGLNHLAHPKLLKRCVGAHYGQVPLLAKLALENKIEAYNLPLGAISRMIRCSAAGTPGHFTKVGLGTFVDPRMSGGKINDMTHEELVELIELDGQEYLRYRVMPPHVAFIRATTGDTEGNLTMEHESMTGDVRQIAMATHNSGGIVIAQVERIAAHGSLQASTVRVPGILVDAVVKVENSDEHHMSFFTEYNPAWSSAVREPSDMIEPIPLDARKVIARRAAMGLKINEVVNLGIGMPEGVASVASEEGILSQVTLTTELGPIGGVGATGVEFGPASNAEACMEMNQQFDFYNGGGLNSAYLGMAQCGEKGDVNVSRLSEDSLTGPGGFIDITQSTRRVFFLGTFMKKGLKVEVKNGKLKILKEGQINTFVKNVREITFSGAQAVQGGQHIRYITERAVFELKHEGLKLIEIAPGIDLQKDILDLMDFAPIVNKDELVTMDPSIFVDQHMELYERLNDMKRLLSERCEFDPEGCKLYVDLFKVSIGTHEELKQFMKEYELLLIKYTDNAKNPVAVIANYEGFDCRVDCLGKWEQKIAELQKKYYSSAQRYTTGLFMRQKLGNSLNLLTEDELWSHLSGGWKTVDKAHFRRVMDKFYHLNLDTAAVSQMFGDADLITKETCGEVMERVRKYEKNIA